MKLCGFMKIDWPRRCLTTTPQPRFAPVPGPGITIMLEDLSLHSAGRYFINDLQHTRDIHRKQYCHTSRSLFFFAWVLKLSRSCFVVSTSTGRVVNWHHRAIFLLFNTCTVLQNRFVTTSFDFIIIMFPRVLFVFNPCVNKVIPPSLSYEMGYTI